MQRYLYKDLYYLETKHWWHISKRKFIQYLIRKYNINKNPQILDVGCGTGRNVEELLKYGQVWGLDNSNEAIKFCKRRGLSNIKKGDAEKTNLPSNSFDVVTLLDVLEHTDDNKTLSEMKRILKKDAILIITVPAFPWLWSEWDKVLHHKRRYTIQSLKEVLKSHNFSILYSTYLYSFLILPVLIIRKIKTRMQKGNYSSDFKLSNPFLNFILGVFAKIEFYFTQKFSLPVGTSIIAVIRNEK